MLTCTFVCAGAPCRQLLHQHRRTTRATILTHHQRRCQRLMPNRTPSVRDMRHWHTTLCLSPTDKHSYLNLSEPLVQSELPPTIGGGGSGSNASARQARTAALKLSQSSIAGETQCAGTSAGGQVNCVHNLHAGVVLPTATQCKDVNLNETKWLPKIVGLGAWQQLVRVYCRLHTAHVYRARRCRHRHLDKS